MLRGDADAQVSPTFRSTPVVMVLGKSPIRATVVAYS